MKKYIMAILILVIIFLIIINKKKIFNDYYNGNAIQRLSFLNGVYSDKSFEVEKLENIIMLDIRSIDEELIRLKDLPYICLGWNNNVKNKYLKLLTKTSIIKSFKKEGFKKTYLNGIDKIDKYCTQINRSLGVSRHLKNNITK